MAPGTHCMCRVPQFQDQHIDCQFVMSDECVHMLTLMEGMFSCISHTHTLGYIVSCRTALIDSCLCEFMIQLNHADVV